MTPRRRFACFLLAALVVTAFLTPATAQGTRLRIGVQKYGTLVLLQQHIADVFRALGLLPKAIGVRDAVWNPQS